MGSLSLLRLMRFVAAGSGIGSWFDKWCQVREIFTNNYGEVLTMKLQAAASSHAKHLHMLKLLPFSATCTLVALSWQRRLDHPRHFILSKHFTNESIPKLITFGTYPQSISWTANRTGWPGEASHTCHRARHLAAVRLHLSLLRGLSRVRIRRQRSETMW